jgi:DNA repair protein RecO (recombination protein O)
MLHKTKGVVLRAVKYGDTSLIVSMFTELFGLQSYIINGVRSFTAKQPARANHFQPATFLEMVVYHDEKKNLQRIKEFKISVLYTDIYRNVHKNAVALFMIELIQKSLKQPESNPELYEFIEDSFVQLDQSTSIVAANFPLYFSLHLAQFFGFKIQDNYDEEHQILDLLEGNYTKNYPEHSHYLEGEMSEITFKLLEITDPIQLEQLVLGREQRQILTDAYINYYGYHQPEFGTMRTIGVLQMLFR